MFSAKNRNLSEKKYYDSCEVFETSTSIRKRKGFGRRGDSGTHTSVNCKESPYFQEDRYHNCKQHFWTRVRSPVPASLWCGAAKPTRTFCFSEVALSQNPVHMEGRGGLLCLRSTSFSSKGNLGRVLRSLLQRNLFQLQVNSSAISGLP